MLRVMDQGSTLQWSTSNQTLWSTASISDYVNTLKTAYAGIYSILLKIK